MQKILKSILFITYFFLYANTTQSQHLTTLIPMAAATHTAQQSGDWFDASTWAEGTVPGDAAIVHIPMGDTVNYQGQSSAHIFAIRVDGVFNCTQTNSNDTTSLTFDTFIGSMMSTIKFHADGASDGKIFVNIKPFGIEAHKDTLTNLSNSWNSTAIAFYEDRTTHYQVTYDIGPDDRFKTYAKALLGNTSVTELSRVAVDDDEGILGRTNWDSTQLSIGLITMGQLEIIGQEKSTMAKLSADAIKGTKAIEMESIPEGWAVGDSIIITAGGNKNAVANATEPAEIKTISGSSITTLTNLKKNHMGRVADDLHCYVGNLTRNIVFRSVKKDSTHRAHLMAMHNDMNVQIKNAAFIDMGRTDKGKLTDDRIWDKWLEPVVGNPYVSALGQECSQMKIPPKADISNHRGRYSIHLHQLGSANGSNMAQITGNVIWGNPGWGITHHSSHANVSENVIYDVIGSALVSEAGDETGFWDNNLIAKVSKGHTNDDYESSLLYDDYLFSGQGLGMKGRAVVCRGNVIADANEGIGIVNFNSTTSSTARVDAAALATVRPGYMFDQFPLSQNGYAKKGDGILPLEVALILENNTVINSNFGLSSIERDMGVNHESRSVFHNLKIWGASTGVRITYQNDYSFRNLFISGRNDNAIGLYMWKHAHNHSFEGLKLVDLKEGITASKLVENSDYSTAKTRNNGFTPWLFIDLETENVTNLYGIHLYDESSPTSYTEHPDNALHLTSDQLSLTRPVTFTTNEEADLEIDLGAAPPDLQFKVDGVVTDRIGAYEFGIEQASSMKSLRNDYPQRLYEFASETKLEEYLTANGVYEDPDNPGQLYFIINELVPDRISYEYKSFPIRIKINNPPSTAPYNNPVTESPAALAPQNELISRFATATQSSDSNSEFFNGDKINTTADRAIDGNSNPRINAGYYQFGLDSIGSSSITQTELEPWWEMDLGEEKILEYIDIWNTVKMGGVNEDTASSYFKNFWVLVGNAPFGDVSLATARANAIHEVYKDATVTRLFSANAMNIKGRYIRIQAEGTTKLSIAEVDLIGRSIPTEEDCNGDVSGLAYTDECGNCVGGNTGNEPCALDANYEWGGTATTTTMEGSRLPVELIRFDGEMVNNQTKLDWSTAAEIDVSGFEVQRSNNVRDWEYLTFVNANNRASDYQTWDKQPFNGYTYYRLKIIDNDGSFEYSNIVSVHREKSPSIRLFPNPTSRDVHIEFDVAANSRTEISIVDFLGRVVHQESISSLTEGTAFITINVEGFISGTYYLSSRDGNTSRAVPFVVVRE